MTVMLFAAVGTVQVPAPRSPRRVTSRDRNVAAAGTGDEEHLGSGSCWRGTRLRNWRRLSHRLGFDNRRSPLALIRLQYLLTQTQGFWRDLDKFVVGDEFDGLF